MPKLVTFHCPTCDTDFQDLIERSANGLIRQCEGCFWCAYLDKKEQAEKGS